MSAQSAAITRGHIAHGRLTKHEARVQLRALYDTARTTYIRSSTEIVQLMQSVNDLRTILETCEANMQGVEAGWVRDGQYVGMSNETMRKAQKEILRSEDQRYVALAQQALGAKNDIEGGQAEIERIKLEMRMARLDMEMAIAEVNCLGGEDEAHYER